MMQIRSLLILLLSFLAFDGIAQNNLESQQFERKPVNEMDSKGARNGLWCISVPSRMGEPSTTELGNFDHGTKYGVWYKFDSEGDLMAVENFRNNVLDGEVKYYEQGKLYCAGHYRGLNPKQKLDTIVVIDPVTHVESYRVITTDHGSLRHGTWKYYNPGTGRIIKEEEYQVDELIFQKEYALSSSEDSLYIKQKVEGLPHNKGVKYKLPAGKKLTSYTH
jgi:hypothetical protein